MRQTADGWSKPEYIDKSDDVALYGGGGAWRIGWRSDRLNRWRCASDGWKHVSRLAGGENYWFKVGIAGQLAVVEISHGKALLAYGTPAHPPRTQQVVGAGKPKHFEIALSPAGKRGGVVWDSPSGLWERTFTAGKLGKPVRLASGSYPGRGVVSAAADDGAVVVAWLAGKPLADVFVAVVRPGHSTGYYKLAPDLKPDTAPQVEAGPGGRGLVAYSGAEASGRARRLGRGAARLAADHAGDGLHPGRTKARLDQTNAAGRHRGHGLARDVGADGTAVFAAFTWPGSALERGAGVGAGRGLRGPVLGVAGVRSLQRGAVRRMGGEGGRRSVADRRVRALGRPRGRRGMLDAALACLGAGDVAGLRALVTEDPALVRERFGNGRDDYFTDPYLLWYVAENPIRTGRLPANIVDVARVLVEAGADQFDYALELVASGCVPRECGVQVALIDFLVDAGADPGGSRLTCALAHREREAVEALLRRGAPLTLEAAVATGGPLEIAGDLGLALGTAAIFGRAEAVPALVARGADVNAFLPEAFHPHTTALHQAINAGSLATVRALIAAGADPSIRDRGFGGNALGWAEHLGHPEIAAYLRGSESRHTAIAVNSRCGVEAPRGASRI